METVDQALSALLRNEPWQEQWTAMSGAVLTRRAAMHGIEVMLYQRGRGKDMPADVLSAFRSCAIAAALWEANHRKLIHEVLHALDAAGAEPLLFKGTALAYSLYPDPVQRTRADTDILVAPAAREAAESALRACGLHRIPAMDGDLVISEAAYTREHAGEKHVIDLHWRLSNSPFLASLFSHQELRASSVPIPSLDSRARGPDAVHALLIAALHRQAHVNVPYYHDGVAYRGDLRMGWMMDIALLCARFEANDWDTLWTLARKKGLVRICRSALEDTHTRLGGELPRMPELASLAEPAERYFKASGCARRWLDIAAERSWGARLNHVRELVFPPREYMRTRYADSRAPLFWLYALRAAHGMHKAFAEVPLN